MKNKDILIIMRALKNALYFLETACRNNLIDDLFVDIDTKDFVKQLSELYQSYDKKMDNLLYDPVDWDKFRELKSYLKDGESLSVAVPAKDDVFNYIKFIVTKNGIQSDLKEYCSFGQLVNESLGQVYASYKKENFTKNGKKKNVNKAKMEKK